MPFCPFFLTRDPCAGDVFVFSLHDALPIFHRGGGPRGLAPPGRGHPGPALLGGGTSRPGACRYRIRVRCRAASGTGRGGRDRKSTRLNSSHVEISYAVFCLKKKIKSSTTIS